MVCGIRKWYMRPFDFGRGVVYRRWSTGDIRCMHRWTCLLLWCLYSCILFRLLSVSQCGGLQQLAHPHGCGWTWIVVRGSLLWSSGVQGLTISHEWRVCVQSTSSRLCPLLCLLPASDLLGLALAAPPLPSGTPTQRDRGAHQWDSLQWRSRFGCNG